MSLIIYFQMSILRLRDAYQQRSSQRKIHQLLFIKRVKVWVIQQKQHVLSSDRLTEYSGSIGFVNEFTIFFLYYSAVTTEFVGMMNTTVAANSTEIYLARHGETTLSGCGQYIGSTEVPLSEHGKTQAHLLAETLGRVHFDACYCSVMGRCRETAQILAAPHKLDIIPIAEIREIDYGQWEGLNLKQMEALAPETFRKWKKDPGAVRAPQGESGEEVLSRILPAFEKLASEHLGQRILIAAHRTVNRIWLCHLLGYPVSSYRKAVGQDFTALNIIEYTTDGNHSSFSVKLMNDTGHLTPME